MQLVRSRRKAPAEGGNEVSRMEREWAVVTATCLSRPRPTRAVWTLCIAGRRLLFNDVSLRVRTSLPTKMLVMLVAGRWAWTLDFTQDWAWAGSWTLER
ncbi:hypothetical protein ACFX1X_015256 [Malus domestica]